ncbi:fido (protein-threonine AMPylation protein) [Rhizobium sp. SG_E_25_P2]|uniref:Fic family protein n=1 Tax=Rhizobium sp. SG_E_25_P2 TaxID=2879942 RepID=UPI00247DE624|nr:fido (protein-threonine AMPylation protein) [Rhizobium sp. SG_E_25_P2]
MSRIFSDLTASGHFSRLAPAEFALRAARTLADINAVHPFREGNGRTQLAFLALLAQNAGLPFNDDLLSPERVIQSMIDSFGGKEEPLAELILEIVSG